MKMKQETLEKVREGDIQAIKEAMAAISDMPRDELKQLWTAVIDGMVSQEETSDGVGKRLMLMSLSFSISPVYTKEKELVGYARALNEGDMKDKLVMIEAITDSSYDEASQTAVVYEDLTALGMVCSGKSLENVGKAKKEALVASSKHAFKHAISIGAALATGMLSGEERAVAKKCLLNAALNGDEYSRKYAVEALAHFTDDYSLKKILVSLEESEAGQITKAASYSLRAIREKDEVETARADLGTLSEIEYPDVTSPQRWYLEIVFDAVETVLTKIKDENRGQEVLVALKQLAAYGAAPGPMKELIDEHSLGMVKKNVENALVHALVHGDERMAEDAKEGLRKSSSERVITILNKVADRERAEDGQLTEKGSMIRALVAEIQKKKFGHSLPPPLPKKASREPRQKMLH
jgi:hypothetical protein